MPSAVRALRGATTIDADEPQHLTDRVNTLVLEMLDRNGVAKADIISILFTATSDIHCKFPATATRAIGLGDVPLMCAQELDITGATARCIRVMMHLTTELPAHDLHHVYLEGARGLNDDLPS